MYERNTLSTAQHSTAQHSTAQHSTLAVSFVCSKVEYDNDVLEIAF